MAKSVQPPVRVGLIGCGGISAQHVQGFLRHGDRIQCVAMCDVSPQQLENRSRQYGRPTRGFADWKRMLCEMAGELDAVDICLPHHLHAEAILDAAAAGLHILCEKPMCTTLSEADQIGQAVRRAGITYMSAHNQLFMPAVREARTLIDRGELGRLYLLRSQDCFWANWGHGGDPFKGSWRASRKTQGGGELIDTGYHPTYRLLHLAGSKVVSVHAQMGRFRQQIEGEDTASVHVRFESGAIGEILTSWAFPNPYGTHQIHVVGSGGQLCGSLETLYFLPQGWQEPAKMALEPVNTFEAQIGHFAQCLIEGARPVHGYEEGRAVLELILKATESAAGWS